MQPKRAEQTGYTTATRVGAMLPARQRLRAQRTFFVGNTYTIADIAQR